MRAVIDTNVMVSGLLSPASPPAEVLRRWQAGDFEAVSCATHLSEVAHVLTRPHLAARIPAHQRNRLLAHIVNRTRFVPDRPAVPVVADDPDDDYLVRMARDWNAALITGDRHLLDLGVTAILPPRAFLALLTGR